MLFHPREEGQGIIEYALILILVSIVALVILVLFGETLGNTYSNIVNNL